ncbi:unnamed protein product [Heligmosomoides polygyrus]|uniref:Uncharacterized protein n=1 Tax=Heligmosomoides polygyrus TaxID=6339 RepID=A0A183FH80_HELPZ|nr:unnamed protein product [Heligmosomoides polygyrus]
MKSAEASQRVSQMLRRAGSISCRRRTSWEESESRIVAATTTDEDDHDDKQVEESIRRLQQIRSEKQAIKAKNA